MSKSSKTLADRSALVVRGPADLMSWLGDTSERFGCSQNSMAVAAVEELRRVIGLVDQLTREKVRADVVVEIIGPLWLERLVNLRIGGDELREAWDWWLADQQRVLRQLETDRWEGAERRKGRES